MSIITDPVKAGERLLQFAREGRLVQGTWHGIRNGREVACHLGAAAGITDPIWCPASLMPPWVAIALPSLFDGQSKPHAMAFARRWGEAMVRDEWRSIDWDAVRREWMAFVVQQAKDAAAHAARAAAHVDAYAPADAAHAVGYAARDAQADALMDAIEKSMEVARG